LIISYFGAVERKEKRGTVLSAEKNLYNNHELDIKKAQV
jgi:hypothetical protein